MKNRPSQRPPLRIRGEWKLVHFSHSLIALLRTSRRSANEILRARSPISADERGYILAFLDHALLRVFSGPVHPIQALAWSCSTDRSAGSESRIVLRVLLRRPGRLDGFAVVHSFHL